METDDVSYKIFPAHWLTTLNRKFPKNWRCSQCFHSVAAVVPARWHPMHEKHRCCRMRCHTGYSIGYVLSVERKPYRSKRRKVLTQLTFSSSLPQSFIVVLRISVLYLRKSASRLPTMNMDTTETTTKLVSPSLCRSIAHIRPTTFKLPHASCHSSGNSEGHVTKTKTHRFEIFFRFING